MNKFRRRYNNQEYVNPGLYQKRAKSNPAPLIALMLLGVGAYFHYKHQGEFHVLSNFSVSKKEVVEPVARVKVIQSPTSVTVLDNIVGFGSKSSNQVVANIEKGTRLTVLGVAKTSDGRIAKLKVRSNGLVVWIKNFDLKHNYD